MKTLRLAFLFLSALAALGLSGCSWDNSSGSSGTLSSTSSSTSSSSPAPSNKGAATLSWEAPTTDTNGAPLTNLAGYRIYYGLSASDLSATIQITTVGIQTYVIDTLSPGTWYFAIKAVTSTGVESSLSDIVSKTIG